jgi:hypothetical protein
LNQLNPLKSETFSRTCDAASHYPKKPAQHSHLLRTRHALCGLRRHLLHHSTL